MIILGSFCSNDLRLEIVSWGIFAFNVVSIDRFTSEIINIVSSVCIDCKEIRGIIRRVLGL